MTGQMRQIEEFHKIRRLPAYIFDNINKVKLRARESGLDIIDFGMGNPDLPAPQKVVDKMMETLGKPRTSGYSTSRGIAALRRAQAKYYAARFGVKLDPDTQIVATLGSKEGFANVAQAITAPGDVVLAPNPSYPIHTFGFLMAGGAVRSIPVEPDEACLRALDQIVANTIPKPIAVICSYPSNPTGHVASLDFYEELVRFAKRHELFILSDLAYAELYFDGHPPPSVLEVNGAIDVAVEFTSMSKTFSMAGWRVGFAVGNERIVSALTRVKSYLDYGAFTPMQVAATAVLNGPYDSVAEVRNTYHKRRDVLVEAFTNAGWPVPSPAASMFVWTPLPASFRHMGSVEFATALVEQTGVVVSPGAAFGEQGEGFVRIALVENEQRIRQAARSIRAMLRAVLSDDR